MSRPEAPAPSRLPGMLILAGSASILAGAVTEAAGSSGTWMIAAGLAAGAGAALASRGRWGRLLPGPTMRLLAGLALGLLALGLLDESLERHRVRFDLTEKRDFALSAATRRVLDALESDVEIAVIYRAGAPERHHARDLMTQYRLASERVKVSFVDPDLEPSLARQFPVEAHGAIVVSLGGRERIVREPIERDVSVAIHGLSQSRQALIGFVRGSGEGEVTGTDPLGFLTAATALQHESYRVVPLTPESRELPAELALAVVPHGRQDLLEGVPERLLELRRSGRGLMIWMEPGQVHPRRARLLEELGLLWEGAQAYDLESHLQQDPGTAVVTSYPSHPATRGLPSTLLPGVGPLGIDPRRQGCPWRELIKLSGGTRSTLPDGSRGPEGPLVVAASCDAGDGEGRVVVIGDTDFATNRALASFPVNRELLVACVSWLTRQEELLGDWPVRHGQDRLVLSDRTLRALGAVTALGMPGLLMLVGLAFWLEGRRS